MTQFRLQDRHILWLKSLIHVINLWLLGRIYYLGFSDQLGGDPVEAIIHYTGKGALNLLLLTLLVAPLSRWSHQNRVLRVRRLLGLYCFAWACSHLGNYIAFELQFDWGLVAAELVKRPYIVVGMSAFLILLALAITSLPVLVRKLGRRWRSLHSTVYLAVALVCVHFWWSVKSMQPEPLIYGGLVLVLLSLKRRPLWRLWNGLKGNLIGAKASSGTES